MDGAKCSVCASRVRHNTYADPVRSDEWLLRHILRLDFFQRFEPESTPERYDGVCPICSQRFDDHSFAYAPQPYPVPLCQLTL